MNIHAGDFCKIICNNSKQNNLKLEQQLTNYGLPSTCRTRENIQLQTADAKRLEWGGWEQVRRVSVCQVRDCTAKGSCSPFSRFCHVSQWLSFSFKKCVLFWIKNNNLCRQVQALRNRKMYRVKVHSPSANSAYWPDWGVCLCACVCLKQEGGKAETVSFICMLVSTLSTVFQRQDPRSLSDRSNSLQ